MTAVHTIEVPQVLWTDWAVIFIGLGLGIGVFFEFLRRSVPATRASDVYTLTNFWLILSGIINVSVILILY